MNRCAVMTLLFFSLMSGCQPVQILEAQAPTSSFFPATAALFESAETPSEVQRLRREFLRNAPIVKEMGHEAYNLNTVRSNYSLLGLDHSSVRFPASPLIDTYNFYTSGVQRFALSVRFSPAFYGRIPKPIREVVSRYDIRELDLFFAPQIVEAASPQDGDVLLKTHFWSAPQMGPAHEFRGDVFHRDLLIGVFEAPDSLPYEVRRGEVRPFEVRVHEAAGETGISPSTAAIHLEPAVPFVSFWSVVIDAQEKRAAVTLHFGIFHEDFMIDREGRTIRDAYQPDGRPNPDSRVLSTLTQLVEEQERVGTLAAWLSEFNMHSRADGDVFVSRPGYIIRSCLRDPNRRNLAAVYDFLNIPQLMQIPSYAEAMNKLGMLIH